MSDSDLEIISGPPRPQRSRARRSSRARPVRDDYSQAILDDELYQIELARSSPPPRRRQETVAPVVLDDEDEDDELSLFVSQNPSPAPDQELREAGRHLQEAMDVFARGIPVMERRRQELNMHRQREEARRPQAEQMGQGQEDFIDLTEEPDSPDFPRLALPPMHPPRNGQRNAGFLDQMLNLGEQRAQNARAPLRNPRRQPSGLARTPSLSRSDASINAGRGQGGRAGDIPLIDLTEDGPEPAAVPHLPPPDADAPANNIWNWFARPPRAPARRDPQPAIGQGFEELRQLRGHFHQLTNLTAAMFNNGGPRPQAVAAAADPPANQPDIPEIIGIIRLDYGGGIPADFWDPHHRPEPSKPSYIAPKEPMDGCTRSTGEDVVAICPSCEEELVYDPDEKKPDTPPPAKKPRTKKDRAEHHFMAVKACGHVFCHKCYEDRKTKAKLSKRPHGGSGFRQGATSRIILCAVEGCESEVSQKAAWLGIFV